MSVQENQKLSGNEIATLAIYRNEIFGSDQYHKSLALFMGLIAVGFHIAGEITGLEMYSKYVILFSISTLGAILRLDTLVHRLGEFCKTIGDPWERWKHGLKYDRLHLTVSDIVLLAPFAFSLINTYIDLFKAYGFQGLPGLYWCSMLVIVGLSAFWAITPNRVRIHNSTYGC